MAYSPEVQRSVATGTKNLGNQLGRWAIHIDLPVTKLAKATGATRPTLYSWFGGGTVTQAYRERVKDVLAILRNSSTAEVAWRKICTQFDVR